MKTILTIDIGTSSIRGILYNQKAKALFSHQQEYAPNYLKDNWVEQDPNDWITYTSDIMSAVGAYLKEAGLKLGAIVLTAQRSSVIPLDEYGNPLAHAIMWQDRRTVDLCNELASQVDIVYSKGGLKISPVFSAVKMLWFKKHHPEIYSKTHKMAGIQDFVIHHLTGNFVTDRSLASRTNLFNLTTRDWDPELLNIFSIDREKLCDLIEPGDVAGTLKDVISDKYGLAQNIPVISAGGDQQCAALGLGILKEGDFEVNTGTGGYIITHAETPNFDDSQRIFCNVSAIPGKYILEAGILTSGTIYNWFNNTFYPDRDPSDRFGMINQEVINAPAGANNVLLTPHFKGSGAPTWNPYAKGIFYNVSLETTRGDMARAILEGITSEIAENIEILAEMTSKATIISAAGGLSAFDEYNRIQADMYGCSVQVNPNGEATTLGAWISAMVTMGYAKSYKEAYKLIADSNPLQVFSSDESHHSVYTDLVARKKSLVSALDSTCIYRTI